jgi:hypothetical protein
MAPFYDILNEWYKAVRARVTENVLWRVSEDLYVFDRPS